MCTRYCDDFAGVAQSDDELGVVVHVEGGITAGSAQIAVSSGELDSMLVLLGAFGVVCLFANLVTGCTGLKFSQKSFP